MALFRYKDFEDGTLGPYYAVSATPPTIENEVRGESTKMMQTTCIVAPQTILYENGYNPILVHKFYLRVVEWDDVIVSNLGVHVVYNDAQTRASGFNILTDGVGGMTIRWGVYDGVTEYNPTPVAIVADTTYRIEAKHDWSGTGMKLTWGMAIEDAALTTYNTDYTGGNTAAPGNTYWSYFGINSIGWLLSTRWTEIMWGNEATDYPIGATPLRPKLNTVIRSNARR
jgi:hypothetical protein